MKRTLSIIGVILAISCLFCLNKTAAASLTQSGDVIRDTNTGLEWLIMSRTLDKSPQEIKDPGSELAQDGWGFATQPQIETLLKGAGWSGGAGGSHINYDAAKSIVSMFGHTYTTVNGTVGIQALAASSDPNSFPAVYVFYDDFFMGNYGIFGPFRPDFKSPGFGNWLVRGTLHSNSPPVASPVGGGTYELFSPVLIGGQISDLDGDLVIYKWMEGTVELFSGKVQTVTGGTPVDLPLISIPSDSGAIRYLTLEVRDGVNPPVRYEIMVSILDTTAPILVPLADKTILWPPNRKMVDVTIETNASDNSGGRITYDVMVWSNEKGQGLYDGPSPDWTTPIINEDAGIVALKLRAVRCKDGSPKIYTVRITASDGYGNYSVSSLDIVVPHDKGK